MKRNKFNFILGISLVSFVLFVCILGMLYTPYDPNEMNVTVKSQPPSTSHLLGTDNFGRDILSRVMSGASTTYIVAVSVVLIGCSIGTILGAVTGYYGGWIDEILMRFNDMLTSFPSVLLALIVVSVIGVGQYNVIWALGIIFIPSFARIVRSEFITLKERDFVKNAKLMGTSNFRIMFVQILPNTKKVLLAAITIGLNNAVLAEASMSYLQLGVQPPTPSLGRMLSEAQVYLFTAPWYALAPGIMIVITVLGFSLLNDR